MGAEGLKLAYNQSSFRVTLTGTCGDFRQLNDLPDLIKERARKKLQESVDSGEIAKTVTLYKIVETLIEKARSSAFKHVPDGQTINLTLGFGLPPILGRIDIKTDSSGKSVLATTLASEQLLEIKPVFFVNHLRILASKKGFKANQAQLLALYKKMIVEKKIPDAVLLKDGATPKEADKFYQIIVDAASRALILQIFRSDPLVAADKRLTFLQNLKQELEKKYPGLNINEPFISERIEKVATGPERFGIDIPANILLNSSAQELEKLNLLAEKQRAKNQQNPQLNPTDGQQKEGLHTLAYNPATYVEKDYPGKGLLSMELSEDKMTARLKGFKVSWYDSVEIEFGVEWLHNEIAGFKLKHIKNEQIKRLEGLIRRQKDINGLIIAEGVVGTPASKPLLAAVALTAPTNPDTAAPASPATERSSTTTSAPEPNPQASPPSSEDGPIDMRRRKVFVAVEAGQAIATLAYEKAATPGEDVFGEPVPAPPPLPYQGEIGAGVSFRDNAHFFAAIAGILKLSKTTIEVSKSLIHEGDVNLSSGDIYFKGPVVVTGSVDAGAIIHSGSDVTIKGDIRNGDVYCTGLLTVTGGVTTGPQGMIICRGGIKADFIENSRIYSRGNVEVNKAILTSKVYTQAAIICLDYNAVIAGGEIHVWEKIEAGRLGFDKGVETLFYFGEDWKQSQAIMNKQKRLARLKEAADKLRVEIKELKKKSQAQLSAQRKQMMDDLEERINRIEVLSQNTEEFLEQRTTDVLFNEQGHILVRDEVVGNCQFFVNRKPLSLPERMVSVMILAKDRNGELFLPLTNKQKRRY